jgi:hypothetical protein
MRTTLDINDRLLAEAKVRAVREKTTLTRLIEEGLRLRLRPPVAPGEKVKIDLPSGTGGLAPGVNPLSNRSLLGEDD